jgi:hypothetical protein
MAKRASSRNNEHGWSKQRKESSRKEWRERECRDMHMDRDVLLQE